MQVIIQKITSTHSSYFLDDSLFPIFLFNKPLHLLLQEAGSLYEFVLVYKNKPRAIAYIHENNGLAFSPFRAPFGGIEFDESLPYEILNFFIDYIEHFCSKQQLQSIFFKLSPFSYRPEQVHILSQVLWHRRYSIVNSELTHYLPISSSDFNVNLHSSAKRRLGKCHKAGFSFEELLSFDIEYVYEFIKACRLREGFPISMPLHSFKKLFEYFPEAHKIFAVKDGATIIALTVTIRVSQDILYNFYPADHPDYQNFSPTIMLLEGTYNYCRQQRISLLDLGISTDQGFPNLGLIRFKKNMGAQSSLKLSFKKDI